MRERAQEWDEEPIGDLDTGIRRRWRRPWNQYLAIMIGFFGFVMLCGSFTFPGWHTVGALLVLASPVAIARSDGRRARAGAPPPPPPSVREELTWAAVALAMITLGAVIFAR